MNPLLVQIIAALVVLITLMMHLLMGYLLWLQCRDVAEQDRQREVRSQRLAARRTKHHPLNIRSGLQRVPVVRIR